MLAYLYGFLEDAEDGGAAAGHGCVDGTEIVELLLDGSYLRVECKDTLLEVIGQFVAPGLNGLHDDVAAAFCWLRGLNERESLTG